MTIRNTTPEAILSVLKTCRPGDVVAVSGKVTPRWPGLRFADPGVTVVGRDGATLDGWAVLRDCAGLTIKNFRIVADNNRAGIGVGGGSTERVVMEDCDFTSVKGGVRGAGAGAVLLGGVAVRNSYIHDADGGLSIQHGLDHEVTDCRFERLSSDAINMRPDEGAEVRIRRSWFGVSTSPVPVHLDAIQLLSQGPHYTVLIEDCEIDCRDGTPMQGVFTDNGGMTAILRRNSFRATAWHAIGLNNPAPGTIIEDNFIQGSTKAHGKFGVMTPWLLVMGAAQGVTVRGNWTTTLRMEAVGLKAQDTHRLRNAAPGDDADYRKWRRAVHLDVASPTADPIAEILGGFGARRA